jgi:hypothetical protein
MTNDLRGRAFLKLGARERPPAALAGGRGEP